MKSNKTFMILSAIGIVFVVDAHAWTSLDLMTTFFKYNSFFMPMFIFISGYFNKERYIDNLGATVKKKVVKLLLPYFFWIYFYILMEYILSRTGIINYGRPVTLYRLFVQPWTNGELSELMAPLWFVPALFMTEMSYIILRKIFRKYWNEIVWFVIFILIGAGCVYLSRAGYNTESRLLLLKTGFFLQFYELGIVYKKYVQKYFVRCPKLIIMVLAIVINTFLIVRYNDELQFDSLYMMGGFMTNNCFLPLITSITGISFWLSVSMILSPVLGNSKVVQFVSNHTFEIMTHHIFSFNVYNCVLYLLCLVVEIPFDTVHFRTTAWYRMEEFPQLRIFYLLAGLILPCVYVLVRDRFNKAVKYKVQNKKREKGIKL